MNNGFMDDGHTRLSVRSLRTLCIIICVVLVVASAIVAAVLISQAAPVDTPEPKNVVAILPLNDALIGLNADLSGVNVQITYSDGTSETRPLSELAVTGLDTSEPGTLSNVVLNFAGFTQIAKYTVVPVEKVLRYIAQQGGSIEGDTVQHVTSGGNAATVLAVPDEGYKFVEWSDGVKQAQRTDLAVSQDKEISARFVRITYKVIFYYANGTTAREQDVEHGYPVLYVPTEENDKQMQMYGYKFTAWSVDTAEIKSVTRNLYVYPQYTKYAADFELDISLAPDGSALATAPDLLEYYTKDQSTSVMIVPNPARTFIGWEILTSDGTWMSLAASDGQTRSAAYAINSSSNLITFSSSKNGVRDEYLISFTPTPATSLIQVRAKVVYNTSEITFTSMTTTAHQAVRIDYGYTLGSKFDMGSEYNEELFTAVQPADAAGYNFIGWYVRNGAVDENGIPVLVKNGATFDAPTELIAYHEKRLYSIKFTNGGDQTFTEKTISLYWQDVLGGEGENAFPTEIPHKTNYTFVGWYKLVNDMETNIFVDKLTRVDGDMQLYPKFIVNTKELKVEAAGSGTITITVGGKDESIYGSYSLEVDNSYTLTFTPATG